MNNLQLFIDIISYLLFVTVVCINYSYSHGYHHHHHHVVFLEWPKQQRHHEDHYSQSKYEQYQTVL